MRTYSYVKMVVDGKETSALELVKEHNVFQVYEYGMNVFAGSYGDTIKFIEDWKKSKSALKAFIESNGSTVLYEQTIR